MQRSPAIADALTAFAIAALVILSGIKAFDPWDQVSLLWESAVNPLLLIGHPHMPRYLVAYPGFLLHEVLPDVGFSIYIAIFFASNATLLSRVAYLVNQRRPSILAYACFLSAHLAMNGRGVIAWTGWLLCMWVCLKVKNKATSPISQLGWIALSCWLSAVSTGVFIVVMVAFLFFMLGNLRSENRKKSPKDLLAIVVMVPLGYALVDYLILAILKNVEFYGGGIDGVFNMLQHGLGVIFIDLTPVNLLLTAFFAYLSLFVMILAFRGRPLSMLEQFIALPLIGGFFGFTVLTLAIPSLLLRLKIPRLQPNN